MQQSTSARRAVWCAAFVRRTLIGACALAAIAAVGCSDDPAAPASGFEAVGTVVSSAGVARAVDSSGVTGSIEVVENEVTPELSVQFIAKTTLARTTPTGSGYTLGWTVADETVATVEQANGWTFKVRGKKAGNTTVVLKVKTSSGTSYTSAAIPIVVRPAVMGLAKGDTATFNYRDRDTMNNVVPGSERKRTWIVDEAGLSLYGKTNVSRVYQRTYDASGTTVATTDTLYLVTETDGSVYQYDYLRVLLSRVSDGGSFSASLPALWVKLTNVNLTTAATWSSLPVDSQVVKNVTPPGIPTSLDVTFRLAGTHRGAQSATVPAGTYAGAVHTDHALKLVVKLSTLPITALTDSLMIHCDAAANDGVLRLALDSKTLVANVLTATQALPVSGFEMELVGVARKK